MLKCYRSGQPVRLQQHNLASNTRLQRPCQNRVRHACQTRRHKHSAQSRQQLWLHAKAVEAPETEVAETAQSPDTSPESEASTSDSPAGDPIPTKLGINVRVQNLYKDYVLKKETYRAIEDVTLDFPANQIIALLGPSGSGKTTLLRMIAGLETVTDGQIFFEDEDATDMPVQDRQIGMVFQGYALFRHLTVAQNISFGPRMQDLDVDEDARVQELLNMVELPDYGNHKPAQLSGGQRQRIALARALACNPKILLLDEPFGALDPQVRATLRDAVKEIIHRVGVTSIIVTHDQDEAFGIADKVVIFNRGQVQQEGSPEEIITTPANPFVMNFIYDVNHLPASCQFVKRMGVDPGNKTHVMLRPILITMFQFAEPGLTCPATITDIRNIGYMVKYFLVFDDDVKFEVHAELEENAKYYSSLEIKTRVHVQAFPEEMKPFNMEEVDSTPLV